MIPGGESTTITKALARDGLDEAIVAYAEAGGALLGTCAGMIVLDRGHLGLLDVDAERNAFGRQRQSFEHDLEVEGLGPEPLRAVFIRAPWVAERGDGVEVLASFEGHPVVVREGRTLACSFHPELTDDTRLHALFMAIAEDRNNERGGRVTGVVLRGSQPSRPPACWRSARPRSRRRSRAATAATSSRARRAATRSPARAATTGSSPAAAATGSGAARATTSSRRSTATTASPAAVATTGFTPGRGTTRSQAAPGSTRSPATPAATASRAAPAPTISRAATATTGSSPRATAGRSTWCSAGRATTRPSSTPRTSPAGPRTARRSSARPEPRSL